MKILLWDIDGTLINNDRAGMHAWAQALSEHRGEPVSVDSLSPAGMTDGGIAQLTIEQVLGQEPTAQLANDLLGRYVQLLPEWLHRRSAGRILPNVVEILEMDAGRTDVVHALLTGNVEAGGRAKLQHYGLLHHFAWGAFADGCTDRREIAQRALATALARHGPGAVEALFVIGDTERDIDCGKAIDARTIAVGTGPYTAAELRCHEPWWATDELPDAAAFYERLDA